MEDKSKIIIGVLITLVVCLTIGLILIYVRYEKIEDKYDDLVENYYDKDGSFQENNNPNNDSNNTNNKYISRDNALEIALKNLNVTEDKIYDLDIEMEYKNRFNTLVYEVSFDYELFEYEYYINAYTGEVLDSLKSRD